MRTAIQVGAAFLFVMCSACSERNDSSRTPGKHETKKEPAAPAKTASPETKRTSEKPHEKESVRQFTRDEFKELVMNKTSDEIIAAIGQPFNTDKFFGQTVWRYRERTFDPLTKKVDEFVTLWFEPKTGKVRLVTN